MTVNNLSVSLSPLAHVEKFLVRRFLRPLFGSEGRTLLHSLPEVATQVSGVPPFEATDGECIRPLVSSMPLMSIKSPPTLSVDGLFRNVLAGSTKMVGGVLICQLMLTGYLAL